MSSANDIPEMQPENYGPDGVPDPFNRDVQDGTDGDKPQYTKVITPTYTLGIYAKTLTAFEAENPVFAVDSTLRVLNSPEHSALVPSDWKARVSTRATAPGG